MCYDGGMGDNEVRGGREEGVRRERGGKEEKLGNPSSVIVRFAWKIENKVVKNGLRL